MKNRTISIRVSHQAIARCFLLYDKLIGNAHNLPIGTVVGNLLEGMSLVTADQFDGIIEIVSDEQAVKIILGFIPDRSRWHDEITFKSPDELEQSLRKATPKAQEEKEEWNNAPRQTDEFMKELQDEMLVSPVMIEEIASRREAVLAAIERQVDEIKTAEEAQLLASVTVIRTSTIESAEPENIISEAPWKNKDMLSEEDVKDSSLYQAACRIDELYPLAVRIVYAKIPMEIWDGEKAVELVRKAYKIFKEYNAKNRDNP